MLGELLKLPTLPTLNLYQRLNQKGGGRGTLFPD